MHSKEHWENVYTTKAANAVSWFQEHAETSLNLIQTNCPLKNASIIDIGGGASTLVDDLLLQTYANIAVLDLSSAALKVAQARIGTTADQVNWIEADITKAELPQAAFDLWHDRAVFHFLTAAEDRRAYVKTMFNSVKPKGKIIISTFAEDGPTQCSGLPVMRYSAETLQAELGELFILTNDFTEIHPTPFGTTQKFIYCQFERAI